MAHDFKAIWIIGASTGIGRTTALAFAKAGVQVIASARKAAELESLAAEAKTKRYAGVIHPLPLDATDRSAVFAGLDAAEALVGEVGAVLYCAATWSNDRESQAKADIVRPVFEVNVFGALNMIEAALAKMSPRKRGRIAVISSVAGFRGLPRALAYGSSKAALTHICEALRFDCEPQGITVQVIHPGFVRTPLTDKNDFNMPFLMEPEPAAQRIVDGMATNCFEITFPRRFTHQLKLLRALPYAAYFALVKRATKNI
jgi:NAD(P)-dependent dehydrogenase (short-subunit alcohol dehydrogenase family)